MPRPNEDNLFEVHFEDGGSLALSAEERGNGSIDVFIMYNIDKHGKTDVINFDGFNEKDLVDITNRFLKKNHISYSFEDIDVDYGIIDDMDILLKIF